MRLETQLRNAFEEFSRELESRAIAVAREHELVSLFVLGPLRMSVSADAAIRDIRQIGIDVAVEQVRGSSDSSAKDDVCKDLVIWPEPGMTFWGRGSDRNEPLAVVEWKTVAPSATAREAERGWQSDQAWLRTFVARHPSVEGYAVFVRTDLDLRPLCAARITATSHDPDWLRAHRA